MLFLHNPFLVLASHLFFISISFYALQALRFDVFIQKNKVFQAQLLFILLSIAIGATVSNLFLDLSAWTNRFVS
ncbi:MULTISPECIES: DUF1146 family protein [Savagea]|uniref:DUF1146 domain-containing protein n=2 Tax=Savagea TaxID=1655429 RepID=A0A8J7G8F7_9BACL|nr:DUF1146 family protein [Savagea serpentis]MBF4501093.1 DUF1146 domain-containing protein [Savagea serpentis]